MALMGTSEVKSVSDALLAASGQIPVGEEDSFLSVLEEYECWQPIFRYTHAKFASKTAVDSDYIRLARISALNLEDYEKSATYCEELVKDLGLSYADFRVRVLSYLIGQDDFQSESLILEAIKSRFVNKVDLVRCLERLCNIYEKKNYNEQNLSKGYQDLIDVDPGNVKALKYFKALYTQEQKWSQVVETLERLYHSSNYTNDRYRIALELATVYLFQLDLPAKTIEILEKYCSRSPLDISSIQYEAFYAMHNWTGCLSVLDDYIKDRCPPDKKAIVFFKKGELQELNGNEKAALDSYSESVRLQDDFLEPIENMVEIYVSNARWDKVIESLKIMRDKVSDTKVRHRIVEAIERVESGIAIG